VRARVPRWDARKYRKGRDVIKKLKRILGLAIGPSEYSPNPSVIGSVEETPSGNTALRIGKVIAPEGDREQAFPSWQQSEYVVINSEERRELITTLESQDDYKTIKCGDIVGESAIVLAVHYVNGAGGGEQRIGTILGWIDHKNTYVIYTADPYGEVGNGTYRVDSQRANNAYIARLNDHFFRHFNSIPPTITYAHVAERDRLTVTS
jgi:hypothetical protein